jgi:hypothetical protein
MIGYRPKLGSEVDSISLRYFTGPLDRKTKGRRLIFNPSPGLNWRAILCHRWCSTNEMAEGTWRCILDDRRPDKSIGATRLDPGESAPLGS